MTVAVSAELVEELRALPVDDNSPSELAALDTMPLLLGLVIASARAEGHDECDQVEILCRAARFEKRHLRECETVLLPDIGVHRFMSSMMSCLRKR